MKSLAERGRIGAWAYEARADADLSVEEVAERLAREGQPVKAATIRGIEGGSKQPSMRLLRAMAKVYGTTPPNERAGSVTSGGTDPASLSELAQAIREMTAGVRAMLDRVDLDRVEKNEIRIGALEAQMAAVWSAIHPEPVEDGASPARHAPRGKGG